MRKTIIFSVSVIFLLLLAACGGNDGTSEASNNSNGENMTLRVAGQNNEDHPNTVALEKMAETVSEKTDGCIEMEVYPANQLGDYTLMYEEIGKGTVDMGLISTPTHLDSRLEMNILPYLFTNYDQVREHFQLDTFFGETLQEIHNEQNIQLLGFFAEGFGGIGTTKEITAPLEYGADKDVLLRVPQIDITTQNAKQLGFNTVSVPYAELYTALQSGTAEGWTGGHPLVNYLQYSDIITHYYQYNDFFEATHLLVNKDLFDGLSEEDQKAIQEASNVLTEESFDVAEENEKMYREKMEEEGIEVYEFTDEELTTLAEKARENVWPEAEETIGRELLDKLIENVQ
ncbi:TRAP-type C4-dicarboxylate transport system, substrate-binding protein [Lentibacillus halodurans]|uniref:TRAP-type C4-dicarboxylate transport system, substrate-binding protein n=1 Tax=Lentibacillus halodurans TaxID=237679 RepID=A0A1I0XM04_9BACI|nr:TRAP transporter substrate-binding protein DctP [Lentibacillus halodurans]SFB02075.1 TRAP-type C4-dicarboxylate transport system, substrate-binding protein [Lentibacillus halodurans]